MKKIFIILCAFTFITSWSQSEKIQFSEKISVAGFEHKELFENAINWYLGARREDKVDNVLPESGILESNRLVYFSDEKGSYMHIGLDIVIKKPQPVLISYTVAIKTYTEEYSFSIENFYYKLIKDKDGECYQYTALENDPPEDCKSTWGLVFYKNARANLEEIVRIYMVENFIPQLKDWMKRKRP
ncbi:hypothetical protein GN157_12535 [Flavobacterium rakeshii]|uniref:DUF4468 domain-containing protein n=1 Tax=Flavobacterium rakeshii TaxID=1038845 RepID=A0A6N8HFN2_9FLAO|nr:hypothetical protein [Flavobacterium rakeshii]MUV04537.1 hypothetical protein [Flavobacterium rakeshii]